MIVRLHDKFGFSRKHGGIFFVLLYCQLGFTFRILTKNLGDENLEKKNL
jgi:hypothetical protein